MNFGAMPEPMLHPHSSAPIDLDRLEQINWETSLPPQRGRTTAFVVHMVGCALVARADQEWLYVADTQQSVQYAMDMFLAMLNYESSDHSCILNVSKNHGRVEVAGEFGIAYFYFKSLCALDPFIRGRIIQDYFLDVCDNNLYNYNIASPGVLQALPHRLEITYDQR